MYSNYQECLMLLSGSFLRRQLIFANYQVKKFVRKSHIFLTVPSFLVEDCCQPGEIVKNGICTACLQRHIPDDDQNNCKACNPDQIAIGGNCESCPAGHVPDNAQNQCVACILPKIAKAGNCTTCPLGQIPMNNQTICIETSSK